MPTTVNMREAKTGLSRLVADIETGKESEIILARNGKPVAKLVPIEPADVQPRRLGLADGQFGELDDNWFRDFQALDEVIWRGVLDEPIDPDERVAVKRTKKSA
ncbi:MAG: prevent-host-death protein [Alphaproteobacteria bacterium]|nr:MAG: prevent-host-death protein [Alphaproteobacteria bacterium]